MREDVKPRRRYNATRRQAQAAQTRQDILDAAHQLFLERGYAGATLTVIAQPAIHARAGPLLRVLVGAAAADPELAELWAQLEDERRNGLARFAQLLADRGVLRPELSVKEARDLLWTLNSLAVHDLLVLRCGWSPERYRDWLGGALARELLPHRQPPRPRRQAQPKRSPGSDSA